LFDRIEAAKIIVISFSGGRTSAYMTKRLIEEYSATKEIIILFANTGEEDERTLKFVDQCEKFFGHPVIWLEAVVIPERGKGTTFKVVNFETATRPNAKEGPFEQVTRKFGISNRVFPNCTRELKERPIWAYVRSLGLKKGEFVMPIGIRADEKDRVSEAALERNIVYPLIPWDIKKTDVIAYWKKQTFDLYLPEHLGNCAWCWKKSLRKHLTLAIEKPDVFETPKRFEDEYAFHGPGHTGEPRRFFRQKMTVDQLKARAKEGNFEPFVDGNEAFDPELDVGGGCGDSCEAFADYHSDDLAELLG
jgi:3'-phosphoadenosine 5'-phosphosulfate sulfotransferase (PAPS reductase)/FAD synthetase